jgi:hypothetical protein
MSGSQNVFI